MIYFTLNAWQHDIIQQHAASEAEVYLEETLEETYKGYS